MQIPDPDRTREVCPNCGHPTVLAHDGINLVRIHCGTHNHHCHQRGDR